MNGDLSIPTLTGELLPAGGDPTLDNVLAELAAVGQQTNAFNNELALAIAAPTDTNALEAAAAATTSAQEFELLSSFATNDLAPTVGALAAGIEANQFSQAQSAQRQLEAQQRQRMQRISELQTLADQSSTRQADLRAQAQTVRDYQRLLMDQDEAIRNENQRQLQNRRNAAADDRAERTLQGTLADQADARENRRLRTQSQLLTQTQQRRIAAERSQAEKQAAQDARDKYQEQLNANQELIAVNTRFNELIVAENQARARAGDAPLTEAEKSQTWAQLLTQAAQQSGNEQFLLAAGGVSTDASRLLIQGGGVNAQTAVQQAVNLIGE